MEVVVDELEVVVVTSVEELLAVDVYCFEVMVGNLY